MSQASDNPYSHDAMKQLPHGPEPELNYFESYQYVFNNPNWMTNILMVLASSMIPMIGKIVIDGYFMYVVESLHFRQSPTYPDFDFNRFSDYLMRGLWPFLVTMIAAMCIVPVMFGLFLVPPLLGAIVAAISPDAAGVAMVIAMLLVWAFFMVFSIVVNVMLSIMTLRAAWTEDLMEGLNLTAAWDFVSKMWVELILEQLFLMITGPVLVFCGLALCIVGVFPVAALLMFAKFHFTAQIYGIYLARGGIPIVIKKKLPPAGYSQVYAGPNQGPYPPPPLK